MANAGSMVTLEARERRARDRALRLALSIATLGLCAILADPVRAAWYESYDRAERAIEAGRWAEAIQEIQTALEEKPAPNARARTYGMNFRPYFPFFKRGMAYYRLGRTEQALQDFEMEERLGAITESPADLAELRIIREEIQHAGAEAKAAEQQKKRDIVAAALETAERHEREGRLDEALQALEQAIAVAPDAAEVGAALDRIQAALTRRERDRSVASELDELTRRGRSELDAGRYEEAASLFGRALGLRETAEVRGLLDTAQDGIRKKLEAERSRQEIAASIAGSLAEARRLKEAGDFKAALLRLQTALALDPRDGEARRLQGQLVELQAALERDSQGAKEVETLLGEAQSLIAAGELERALVVANRALAADPSSEPAKGYLAQAYARLSRKLLGKNLAPILNLTPPPEDSRAPRADGSVAERITAPELVLAGNVSDEGPVSVEFFEGKTLLGHVSPTPVHLAENLVSMNFRFRVRFPSAFSFHRELSTVFRAVATDEEKATAEAEYAVVYAVPLQRSLWSYSAAAVLAASAVAAYGARRARWRNRLRQRRFNPYVAGAPVLDDEMFFGREQLLDRVLQTVHNNSILLYGERRIGKTSLQHRLKRRLGELADAAFAFHPVYIDLQGTPQEKFFSTLAEDIFHELAPLLDGHRPGPALADPAAYQYRDFVRDLTGVLGILKAKSAKKVKLVLLIDEVDELNRYDPRINQRLRSLFMRDFSENLAAVVSGVAIKKHWESEGSPWYNFFEEIEVKPFGREDAAELIRRPIRGIFTLDPGVVDRIIEVTACRPYLIQKTCVALVNRLHERGSRRITLADVQAVGLPAEG